MNSLTHDEMTLMSIYALAHNTPQGLIEALKTMRGYLAQDETELRALTDSTLAKLDTMRRRGIRRARSVPDFEETEDNDAE
jgi:hypothetical protein